MGAGGSGGIEQELADAVRHSRAPEVQRLLGRVSAARCIGAPEAEARAAGALDLNAALPREGLTALQLAASCGHADVCRLLLDFDPGVLGVDPDAPGSRGRGPLHFAAAAGSADCVALLLEREADPCVAAADDGQTPLELARAAGSAPCVEALESGLVLWEGWVDHYEQEYLVFPTWKVKRLAVVRDRRPNSGPIMDEAGAHAAWPCYKCGSAQHMPRCVRRFHCTRCGAKILVPASLQMAIYEPKSGFKRGRRGDVEISGVLTQRLPHEPTQIIAKAAASNSAEGTWGALWEGRVGRALMTSVESTYSHGLSVSVMGPAGKLVAEHCFRLDGAETRARLLGILWDPARASLRVEMRRERERASANKPATAPPAALAAAGIPEASAPPASPMASLSGESALGPAAGHHVWDPEHFRIPEASAPPPEDAAFASLGGPPVAYEVTEPQAGGRGCLGCCAPTPAG